MLSAASLHDFVKAASAALAREPDLAGFEIYAASGEQIVTRLNYTSDIPARGMEETKSVAADGFGVRVTVPGDVHAVGAAFSGGELSLAALRQTLAQARRNTVADPHFHGLPRDSRAPQKPASAGTALARLHHLQVAGAGWKILRGALLEFARAGKELPLEPGLIIGGDVTLTRERIAVAGSGLRGTRVDESAYFTSTITALIESIAAKAAASAAGSSPAELRQASARLGREAIGSALRARGAIRPPAGRYRILFGPQPMAEILSYMVIPSLTATSFYRADSAYHGRWGGAVMDSRLSLSDDPRTARGALHRRLTCEGIPTARTELVRAGKLVGLLAGFYDAQRLLHDGAGKSAPEPIRVRPRHGFRLGAHGGRRFDAMPRANPSNIFLRGTGGVSDERLIRELGDGIYVGRVWYTYPINGQRAGDFTCTISGDSYLVEGGRIVAPIMPNCLRINAHIDQIFGNVRAIGSRAHTALVWGEPGAFYVPGLVADAIPMAVAGEGAR